MQKVRQPRISLIVAVGKNREIGKDNRLLWHIPEDLQRFKKITLGCPVIMGENTFKSLPFVLPNRTNIVLTRDKSLKLQGAKIASSIKRALELAMAEKPSEIFFIGGASIYRQSLPLADRLYVTEVDKEFKDADRFFPDYKDFSKVISKKVSQDKNFKYTFLVLER
jgi:dihydrofolate reductase